MGGGRHQERKAIHVANVDRTEVLRLIAAYKMQACLFAQQRSIVNDKTKKNKQKWQQQQAFSVPIIAILFLANGFRWCCCGCSIVRIELKALMR